MIALKWNWLHKHGAVAVLVSLALLTSKVNTKMSRRLQIVEKDDIEQQIMVEASNVSVLFSAIFFFGLGVLIVGQHIQGDLHIVQRSILRKRLEYCMFVCLYICFFSCLFNVIQYGPQDDVVFDQIETRDTAILDIGRPIEWLLTCPLMQLILPILGGERVPDYRRWTMPTNSAIILVFGVCAMFSEWLPQKLAFYFCGVFCFCMLVHQMHRCVVESTNGGEGIFYGSSTIRTLVVIVTMTWIPFPIWYALSPEGFNIVKNSAAMKIAVAFLNVLSKGAFIYYLMRVRGDLEVKEMVMAEANVTSSLDQKKKLDTYIDPENDHARLTPKLITAVFEVLQAMGRQADFEPLKEVLENHMITTPEDLMVLTPEYCETICLPYGFVTACKARIRQYRVESSDKWNLTVDKESAFDSVSVATTPLPPQVANDPRKLKEHHRRHSGGLDAMSNYSPRAVQDPSGWNDGMSVGGATDRLPPRPESREAGFRQEGMSKEELHTAIAQSQSVLLNELREMKRAQMEESSKIRSLEEKVEGDLDAVQGMMGGMMTQVMDKIENRLRLASPAQTRQGQSSFGATQPRDPYSFTENRMTAD